jgi:cytochrome P450
MTDTLTPPDAATAPAGDVSPFVPPIPPYAGYTATGRLGVIDYINHFRRMSRNPLEVWAEPHFSIDYAPFQFLGSRYLLVNAPDGVRQVFLTNAANYRMNRMRQAIIRPFLRDGLLTAEGEIWRTGRKAVTPAFTPRRLDGFAPEILSAIEAWTEKLAAQDGEIVSMTDVLVELTLDVLIATLFSGEDDLDKARFTGNVEALMRIAGFPHPLDVVDAPKWLPRIGQLKKSGVIRDLRAQVSEIAARRRARPGGLEGDDFLSLLLGAGLPDHAVVDNLLTFLTAGHETTARSLGWTVYLLSQADAVRDRMEAEIDAAVLDPGDPQGWIDALPYTLAVIKESLRLFPPAAHLPRTAAKDDVLEGHPVKAGTEIIVSPWLLHRHRDLWEEPDAFRPERFLDGAERAVPRGAYIPFGMGPRVCIGARFAMMEMVIALARLCGRMRFELETDGPPLPVLRITLQPDRDLRMRVKARN